jgi:hypothetical protein
MEESAPLGPIPPTSLLPMSVLICIFKFQPDCQFIIQLSELSSVTSLLPGTLVQALITNVHSSGLNLQVLGYFDGTVDEYHMGEEYSALKIGKKVKARVIYDYSSSPPRFALSLMPHIIRLTPRLIRDGETERSVRESYPVGTVLDEVKVLRVEPERGLIAEISDNLQGFVHVSTSPICVVSRLTCLLDFSSFRGPSTFTVQHWSVETRIHTHCTSNRLLPFRWSPAAVPEAFCH